jgi:hypothetical protein
VGDGRSCIRVEHKGSAWLVTAATSWLIKACRALKYWMPDCFQALARLEPLQESRDR